MLKSTNPYCVFCLKTCFVDNDEDVGENVKNEENIINKKYMKLLERYLRLESSPNDDFQFCADCCRLLDSFCDLYNDIKMLEMRLEWKVSTLQNIMRCANQVPSRISNVNDYYTGNGELIKMNSFKDWRKRFIKTSWNKLSRRYPRVKIKILTMDSIETQNEVLFDSLNKSNGPLPTTSTLLNLPQSLDLASLVHISKQVAARFVQLTSTAKRPVVIQCIPSVETEKNATAVNIQKSKENSQPNDKDGVELINLEDASNSCDIGQDFENESSICVIKNISSTIADDDSSLCQADLVQVLETNSSLNPVDSRIDKTNDVVTALSETPRLVENSPEISYSSRCRQNKYRCQKCSQAFSNEEDLTTHKEFHRDKDDDNARDFDEDSRDAEFLPEEDHNRSDSDNDEDCQLPEKNMGAEKDIDETYSTGENLSNENNMASEEHSTHLFIASVLSTDNVKLVSSNNAKDNGCQVSVKKRKVSCKICKAKFSTKKNRKLHYKRQHDLTNVDKSKIINCDQSNCSAYFLSHVQLKLHKVVLHRIRKRPKRQPKRLNSYTCNVCKTKFKAKRCFNLHYESHHKLKKGLKAYNCDQDECTSFFICIFQLNKHMQKSHGGFGIGQRCVDCGKGFTDRSYLRRHRLHKHRANVKLNFPCSGCDKRFESQNELDLHAKIFHTDKGNPFEERICALCGKICYGDNGLSMHIVQFHEEKTEIPKTRPSSLCSLCGKEFRGDGKLKTHLLSHSGPASWDFQCATCGKKCISENKLVEHMRIHSQEKPFVCKYCGAGYGHRHNLRIHVNSKHGDIEQDIARPRKMKKIVKSS